jgi:hypothetical protein
MKGPFSHKTHLDFCLVDAYNIYHDEAPNIPWYPLLIKWYLIDHSQKHTQRPLSLRAAYY